MRRLIRNENGMSLSEVLVSMAIVSIGLVALLSAVPLAAYAIQEGKQLSTATFLANQRLEQARNAQWSASPAADSLGISASPTAAPQSGGTTMFPDESPLAAPYAGYIRQVRITDCGVAPGCGGITNAGLRQVTVTVTYTPLTGVGQAAGGGTKSVVVSMLAAQR